MMFVRVVECCARGGSEPSPRGRDRIDPSRLVLQIPGVLHRQNHLRGWIVVD
jgi:hypothetical protein